jgi:hypothetical protein
VHEHLDLTWLTCEAYNGPSQEDGGHHMHVTFKGGTLRGSGPHFSPIFCTNSLGLWYSTPLGSCHPGTFPRYGVEQVPDAEPPMVICRVIREDLQ